MIQTGYRIGMLASGAGALVIAARAGWFAAYATMAALLVVGMLVFLFGPEPEPAAEPVPDDATGAAGMRLATGLSNAVAGPFADFMRRPLWLVILIFIVGYKLGEGMAAVMATPLYISLGFSLDEIAAMSKLVGFFAIVAGALIGGLVTVRFGILRSLMLCGVLQAVGNLFYVLQARGRTSHRLSRAMRHRGKLDGCNGGNGPHRLSLQPVLARLHRHAVRAAFIARMRLDARSWHLQAACSPRISVGSDFSCSPPSCTVPALFLLVWIARRDVTRPDHPSPVPAMTKT